MAAGVAGPVLGVEAGVVGRDEGVAGVAEDRAHLKSSVADEHPGGEEADFHRPFGREAGDFRLDGPARSEQVQVRVRSGSDIEAVLSWTRERDDQEFRQARRPPAGTGRRTVCLGTAFLSSGDRQPPSVTVERPDGGAAVLERVVQHAVDDAVRRDQSAVEDVLRSPGAIARGRCAVPVEEDEGSAA